MIPSFTGESERLMKPRNRHLLKSVLLSLSLLLNACSFSVQTLATPEAAEVLFDATAFPAADATASPAPQPASPSPGPPTPTLIPIRLDTAYMLETSETFQMGEVVHSLAFTPDGTVLAAAGGNTDDFAIHIWEVASGREIGTLGGHNSIVWGVAFSSDGDLLATVSKDGTAQVRDWRNGDILKVLNFPGEMVSVSFSPDGQALAVGGVDETVNQIRNAAVWTYTVGSWEPLIKFPEYWNISAMAYSPRGGILVGGGTSRNVQVWSTSDRTAMFTLNHAHQVSEAAISPDSATVATGTCATVVSTECTEGGIWLWDLASGRLTRRLAGFPDLVESLAFSVDGSSLIAGSRDGTLRIYATSDYAPHFEGTAPGGVSALALSPDGTLLATGNFEGEVNIWKVVYRP
jgi:WD40 repeat protein